MNSAKIASKIESIQNKQIELQVELEAAIAREVRVIGEQYTILVGKPGSKEPVLATLVAQGQDEKGSLRFRFQYGEGFDLQVVNVRAASIQDDDIEGVEEGQRSAGKIQKLLDKLEADLEVLEIDLVAAEQREHLEDGATYTIRVGRGENQREVLGVLMGQKDIATEFVKNKGTDDEVNVTRNRKVLKFFIGAGFDAEIVALTVKNVVFPEAPEADEIPAPEDFELTPSE